MFEINGAKYEKCVLKLKLKLKRCFIVLGFFYMAITKQKESLEHILNGRICPQIVLFKAFSKIKKDIILFDKV